MAVYYLLFSWKLSHTKMQSLSYSSFTSNPSWGRKDSGSGPVTEAFNMSLLFLSKCMHTFRVLTVYMYWKLITGNCVFCECRRFVVCLYRSENYIKACWVMPSPIFKIRPLMP
ncbi:hypothetical protein CAPTEDRAFT_199548 [Capitella teleta]|uniref:Uncharacterized protein n=1 Tax=Capitella teleta TaxID=283909 RepID=R7UMH5_CAPTE|nr:hypothetical protein CAPTEDRAFT_199548 [Capitella teleta]|eukprot:ELU07739.1 hypothetical protein CAPTEDRAFT_199548 [Capitella teleta]